MQRAIVYDDGKGTLAPLTDLRPVFDVRTGALTTLQRLKVVACLETTALWVPDALVGVTRPLHAAPVNGTLNIDAPTLLYNGRCPVPPTELSSLAPGDVLVEALSGDLVAGFLKPSQIAATLRGEPPTDVRRVELAGLRLMTRPWHVRTFRDRAMDIDLRALASRPSRCDSPESDVEALFEEPVENASVMGGVQEPLRIGGQPLAIAPSARIYPGSILDVENGPIVIAERAVVRPGAIIIGPAYIGPGATVLERATIRPYTAIGPVCKVNGEVGGTIFQGYANKAHDGYLGDSWVGEWVNLGAGTTSSNLLNTYARVVALASHGGRHERTQEQYLGAIIGDHVKTAICTRIGTGAVLHTGGMFASPDVVADATRPFCWRTEKPESFFRIDKFIDVAKTMMARRQKTPSQAYLDRIAALHAASVRT